MIMNVFTHLVVETVEHAVQNVAVKTDRRTLTRGVTNGLG
jgi:hypothetical protein